MKKNKNKKIDNENDDEISFKIITLGDMSVGKTSIIKRFVYNTFDDHIKATIGMAFSSYDLTLKNNKNIKLNFFDTAGQEQYKSLTKGYFKNADGVLFVFALNNKDSFENIESWMKVYEESNDSFLNIPKVLVGNKNDLPSNVEEKLIDKFLKKFPDFTYRSVSAKKSQDNNIKEMFQEMGEKLYENYKKTENIKTKHIKLKDGSKSNKGCCMTKLILTNI